MLLNRNSLIPVLGLLMIFSLLSSCKKDDVLSCSESFFGMPGDHTGLSTDICKPDCFCKDYEPKMFTPADITALRDWTLLNPSDLLDSNPFDADIPPVQEGVCGFIAVDVNAKTYRLQTFGSESEAAASGAVVTHKGQCGMCSSLSDLAVYLERRDLGVPVRECGVRNLNKPFEQLLGCISELGFTPPCAQIWAYNARNTQEECFQPCIQSVLSELIFGEIIPYNNPDGTLSPCIACDEELSGPTFKAYAGRTRRNSGIASAICRLCDEVVPVAHDYPL